METKCLTNELLDVAKLELAMTIQDARKLSYTALILMIMLVSTTVAVLYFIGSVSSHGDTLKLVYYLLLAINSCSIVQLLFVFLPKEYRMLSSTSSTYVDCNSSTELLLSVVTLTNTLQVVNKKMLKSIHISLFVSCTTITIMYLLFV